MTTTNATQAQQLELIASFLNVSKAQKLELAAFKETAALRKQAIRKAALAHFMTDEQAAVIVKSLLDCTDADFSAVVSAYASTFTNVKPVEKAVEEAVEPIDYTRAILEAKYGKKSQQ